MFNAPVPPQFPPGLLALIAALRGGQMAQPPAFGQQPGLQQPPPGFFGQQPQLEQPPQMGPSQLASPIAAAAGSPMGHGAQLPDSGRIPDAVPTNPYNPAPVVLPHHSAHGGTHGGGPVPPWLAQQLQHQQVTHPSQRTTTGLTQGGGGLGGPDGGFTSPGQAPIALLQMLARLRATGGHGRAV